MDMNYKQKKLTMRTVKELYLYPYRSKGENVVRVMIWMASWLIGIVTQSTTNHQALGGAYLIFASSLLLEFVPESRTRPFARCIHGIFCILLSVMLLGALLLIFEGITDEKVKSKWLYQHLIAAPPYTGWAICIMMFISLVLVLIEIHKYFYNESEIQQENECTQEAIRNQFYNSLNGVSQGGKTK